MSESMHIYLSGPMRGRPEFNFPAFIAAEAKLREMYPDAEIFSPARKDIDNGFDYRGLTGHEDLKYDLGFDLRESLAMDMAFIATKATMIYMLDGWSQSSGARAELALAQALGCVTVMYDTPQAIGEVTPAEAAAYDQGFLDGTSQVHPPEVGRG